MVPSFQEFMRPLLEAAQAGICDKKTLRAAMVEWFNLTAEDIEQRHPSAKRERVYENRIDWARCYLGKAGLVKLPGDGSTLITERGKKALAQEQPINNEYLRQFPEFLAFKCRKKPKVKRQSSVPQWVSSDIFERNLFI